MPPTSPSNPTSSSPRLRRLPGGPHLSRPSASRDHEILCRGGPPLAADGAASPHPRASTVCVNVRACDALHRRRAKDTKTPLRGDTKIHENTPYFPLPHSPFPVPSFSCRRGLCRAVFVSRRRRAFVSVRQGAAPKARGKALSVRANLFADGRRGPSPGLRSNPPRSRNGFRGRGAAASPAPNISPSSSGVAPHFAILVS